jgi:hypothetical protein
MLLRGEHLRPTLAGDRRGWRKVEQCRSNCRRVEVGLSGAQLLPLETVRALRQIGLEPNLNSVSWPAKQVSNRGVANNARTIHFVKGEVGLPLAAQQRNRLNDSTWTSRPGAYHQGRVYDQLAVCL